MNAGVRNNVPEVDTVIESSVSASVLRDSLDLLVTNRVQQEHGVRTVETCVTALLTQWLDAMQR